MTGQPKRYRAFISYKQEDKREARRLHRWLERYRVPSGVAVKLELDSKRRLGRFFRDDEEMGAVADLGATVRDAIEDSESLIVMCSPLAAQSEWVNKEILHFRGTGRGGKIFAVIIDGIPNSNDVATECFPLALRPANDPGDPVDMPIEPLGIDLRKEKRARCCARLAAGLLDANFDDLWDRVRRRARAQLIQLSFAMGALVLAIVLAIVYRDPIVEFVNMYKNYRFYINSGESLAMAQPGTTFQDCRKGSDYCPVMVWLPHGEFLMGTREDDQEAYPNERPQHRVSIHAFAASKYEITFAVWGECPAGGGCRGQPNPGQFTGGQANKPVVNVSWHDAQEYVTWLSRMTGQQYRLLTEAEWEYAARGVTSVDAPQTRFWWGNEDPVCDPTSKNGAVFASCPGTESYPVGSFSANPFGLHDLHGNVFEWLEDCWAPYSPSSRDGAAVTEGDCASRVVRGGSWSTKPQWIRSADRSWLAPASRYQHNGFRVARTISPP